MPDLASVSYGEHRVEGAGGARAVERVRFRTYSKDYQNYSGCELGL